MAKMTVTKLANEVQTEADAYAFMEKLRWNGRPVCPHCGSIEPHYYLTPANEISRKTRTGHQSQRRVWKCSQCRKQFSVITNTMMHGSRVSLRIWLFVIFEMCANKNGIAAREIERKYGVANKTAWFMCHRIREAMLRNNNAPLMIGTIVADETWIGGEPKNRHADKRTGKSGLTEKVPVLALVDATTGEVRSKVVADVTGRTLSKVIKENVAVARSVLHTDSATAYIGIGQEFADHQSVNHMIGEYVRHGVTTNMAENYFSQLKRSLDGTHHHVSKVHLPKYLTEFDFRYSTRKISDTQRMDLLMGRVHGKRMTYK